MSVRDEFERWLTDHQIETSPTVEAMRALASEIDSPPTNKNGGETSVVAAVREFRAGMVDLEKLAGVGSVSATAQVIGSAKARRLRVVG